MQNPPREDFAASHPLLLTAFGAALALALCFIVLNPWPIVPLSLKLIELPPVKVILYNLSELRRFEGGYAAVLWGYLTLIAMSAWFYISGAYFLRKILKKPVEEAFSPAELIPARWFLGTAGLAMVWFAFGTLGLMRPGIAKAMVAAGLLAAAAQTVRFIRRVSFRGLLRRPESFPLFAGQTLFSLWIIAWSALCRYPIYYSDTLMINMALPAFYAAESAFTPNPFHVYSYFHQNSELLTTWALLAGSKEAAHLLVWGFFAALLVFLYGWIARMGSKTAALCAIALYAASDCGIWAGTLIKNDLQVGVFLLMSWWALMARFERDDAYRAGMEKRKAATSDTDGLLLLSGLCAGIALGHKFSAAPSVLITAAGTFLYFSARAGGSRSDSSKSAMSAAGAKTAVSMVNSEYAARLGRATKPLGRFGLGLMLAWSPWLIRTAALTGNPIYPFLNGLFGAVPLQPWLTHPGTEHNLMNGGAAGLLAYARSFFQVRPTGAFSGAAIWWGPTAFLCCLGLLTLTKLFAPAVRWVAAVAAASWAATLVFAFKPHVYEGPLVFILCAAFGLALSQIFRASQCLRWSQWPRWAAAFIAVLALSKSALTTHLVTRLATSSTTILSGSPAWQIAQGMSPASPEHASPDEREWMHYLINRYGGREEKILYVGTVFPAGIQRRHSAGLSLNLQPILYFAEQARDAEGLRDALLSMGFRGVLYDPGMWRDWINNVTIDGPHNISVNADALARVDQFMAKHLQLRFKTPSEKLLWYGIVPQGESAPYPPVPILAEDIYQFPYHYLYLSGLFSREGHPEVGVQILDTYAAKPFDRHIEANVIKLRQALKPN